MASTCWLPRASVHGPSREVRVRTTRSQSPIQKSSWRCSGLAHAATIAAGLDADDDGGDDGAGAAARGEAQAAMTTRIPGA